MQRVKTVRHAIERFAIYSCASIENIQTSMPVILKEMDS